MEPIPVSGPWITQKEIDYVTDAAANSWYSNAYLFQERFEKAFARYVGRRHAITLPSCTSGLHLSLLALGIGPGDEVIVPECTWIATSAPISYVGAAPVFVDIDPRSWCMDVNSFEEQITERTKAVIVVDLYGNLPDMDAVLDIARHHGVHVIEDAAQAIGSEYKGRKAGAFGAASVFSFHGTKTLTTGEGGMLVTDDESVYDRCLTLRDHGRARGDRQFWNLEIAHKYKMSSLQAALGLAQLERIDDLVERKREIFTWYSEELKGEPGLTLNNELPSVWSTYWMVTVIMDSECAMSKVEVVNAMSKMGIDCRPFFHPLSSLPAYSASREAELARSRNGTAYHIASRGINLPSGFNMCRAKVHYVCQCLRDVLQESLRRH